MQKMQTKKTLLDRMTIKGINDMIVWQPGESKEMADRNIAKNVMANV